MIDQMTTTIKSKRVTLDLAIQNGPMITDAFSREMVITGITLTYVNGAVTAVKLESGDVAVFVDTVDLDKPETWPQWLRDLVISWQDAVSRLRS